MPISYVAAFGGHNTSASTTASVTVSGGSSAVYVAAIESASGSSNIQSIVQTNVSWTCLNAATVGGISIEVWIGYASGTPGTTVTITNLISCYMVALIYEFTGIPNQAAPLENFYSASGTTASAAIPSVVVANAADLEIAFVGGSFTTAITYPANLANGTNTKRL